MTQVSARLPDELVESMDKAARHEFLECVECDFLINIQC